jgi:radical SAM protein with 4Fe4S-binding SPASM domain
MSLEEFERVIGQFPHLKRADMTGQGENLLSNDFFEMVRRLKSRSVSVTFYDNFTLVSPEIAKQIISSGIDSIVISHDGATRETYEKIRKGAKFDDVISNIKNLMDMKVQMQSKTPDLTFNFVVLKDNVHELPAMVKLASSLGIKFLTFTEGRRYSEMDKFPVDLVAPEERTRIFDETSKTAKSLDVSINFDHFSKTPIKKCSYPFRSCLVRSDGSIYPCCHNGFSDLPSFGNIYDQEFKEIWKSKYFVEVRRSILQGKVAPYCVGCVEYA